MIWLHFYLSSLVEIKNATNTETTWAITIQTCYTNTFFFLFSCVKACAIIIIYCLFRFSEIIMQFVCLFWVNHNTLSYNRIENSEMWCKCIYLNNFDVVLPTKCFYKFVCQWCNVFCFCFFWQQTKTNIVRLTVHEKKNYKKSVTVWTLFK